MDDDDSSTHDMFTTDRNFITEYYHSQCALTKSTSSLKMVPIIPHSDSIRHVLRRTMTWMQNLGLVPPDMNHLSPKNIIPLRPDLGIDLGNSEWAFLPTKRVLLCCIAFEEHHLHIRAATTPDPGRLPYDRSYKHLPAESDFNVYFKRTYPPPPTYDDDEDPMKLTVRRPFPTRKLIASVNVVVAQAPRFIALLEDPAAREDMALANYLHLLWYAAPGPSFDDLERPTLPFTSEKAQAHLEQIEPEFWNGFINTNASCDEPELETRQEEALDEELEDPDSSSTEEISMGSQEGFGNELLTSNDRAFLKYRTVLGGPVLTF